MHTHGRRATFSVTSEHLVALKGIYGEHQYDVRNALGFSPKSVLDLGANIGMAAIYLNSLYAPLSFICVEPDPRNLELLKANIAANSLRAALVAGAISSRSGNLQLSITRNPTVSTLRGSGVLTEWSEVVPVKGFTVDQVLYQHQWSEVDLVKIDIEGAEADLLRSNTDWLARARAIVMELHESISIGELSGILSKYGFKTRLLSNALTEPIYIATR